MSQPLGLNEEYKVRLEFIRVDNLGNQDEGWISQGVWLGWGNLTFLFETATALEVAIKPV